MYILLYLLYTIVAVCLVLIYYRRRQMIKKVSALTDYEKKVLLSRCVNPFGLVWNSDKHIFTTAPNVWNQNSGYMGLFDEKATHYHILFDCEPVYFEYQGRTWMLELWKGQYGIHTGAEIGVYAADHLVSPVFLNEIHFENVPQSEMLQFSFRLLQGRETLFTVSAMQRRLSGFLTGNLSSPDSLRMQVSITFPNTGMMDAFVDSLLILGYQLSDLSLYQLTVAFCFTTPKKLPKKVTGSLGACMKILSRKYWLTVTNRIYMKSFLLLTRPFEDTQDRLIYLQFYLPPLYHKIVCMGISGKRFGMS
ncbi:DUF4474 domain-containing protein [uncultured Robinsoniella sp.]|uniref:DUF4474 domain-containing protein n=1 Tax=uncultured Robinsoniella sp. TaxID=904190 RepID=UPI00374EE136